MLDMATAYGLRKKKRDANRALASDLSFATKPYEIDHENDYGPVTPGTDIDGVNEKKYAMGGMAGMTDHVTGLVGRALNKIIGGGGDEVEDPKSANDGEHEEGFVMDDGMGQRPADATASGENQDDRPAMDDEEEQAKVPEMLSGGYADGGVVERAMGKRVPGGSSRGASTGGVGSGIGGAGTGGAATGGASTGGAGTVTVSIGKSGTGSSAGSDPKKGKSGGKQSPITLNISDVGGTTDAGDVASGDGPGALGEGGETDDEEQAEEPEIDAGGYADGGIVGRAMKRCGYSKGGRVSNDLTPKADSSPNEFDDLVLNDELEEHYTAENSGDLIGRAMKKYSEGGQVSNDLDPKADSSPAEYDDLVLRDDLEQHYTGANSGDYIGRALRKRTGRR